MEILSDTDFHGDVRNLKRLDVYGSEIHLSDVTFEDIVHFNSHENTRFRGPVETHGFIYSCSFDNNIGKLVRIPRTTEITTLATVDQLPCIAFCILSNPTIPVGCNKFVFESQYGCTTVESTTPSEFIITQVYSGISNSIVQMDVEQKYDEESIGYGKRSFIGSLSDNNSEVKYGSYYLVFLNLRAR